jgi:hypothetical protein
MLIVQFEKLLRTPSMGAVKGAGVTAPCNLMLLLFCVLFTTDVPPTISLFMC